MEYPIHIRSMVPDELAFAEWCTAQEGWVSEDKNVLEGFFLNDPAGCLIALVGDSPVGVCFATCYERAGFLGEIIVRPESRRQGIGAHILNHAVAALTERGVETVYLDGVVKAVPLYERNGFRKICRSWRFAGRLAGKKYTDVRLMKESDLPGVLELDRKAFGADRGFFLTRRLACFPGLCQVWVESGKIMGYIAGRGGEGWVSAGPWVVEDQCDHPIRLLESLAYEAGDVHLSLGVLDLNPRAMEIVNGLGFTRREDSPWRMARGPASDLGTSPLCLAVGTAAKG